MKTAMQEAIDKVSFIINMWNDTSNEMYMPDVMELLKENLTELLPKEKEQLKITQDTSDGYHTFKELYEFRKVYNAALFNEWAIKEEYFVHKSWKHNDGELCFGGGWFIVVALLPSGQISNHYEAKDWDLFKIPERPEAMFEFDGHTAQDVLNRINQTYNN